MARKVDGPAKSKASADAGADDLAILHPENKTLIAGRQLTIREYGFIEGLRLMPLLDPLIADLRMLIESGTPLPGSEQIPAFLGNHADALIELMAVAADVEIEWVTQLQPDDGHELLWFWWCVNGPFCVRAASRRTAIVRATDEHLRRVGQTSMPSSSQPATAAPTPSDE